MQYWEHFKNEEWDFVKCQQHQEREDEVEEEVADEVLDYYGNENNAGQHEEADNVPLVEDDDNDLYQQKILGENGEKGEVEVERLLAEEETTVYFLNLPVVDTAANNHRPNWNGNWLVPLNDRSQYRKQARATALLIATHLLVYKRTLCYHAKLQIARAACTLVAYDYGYKKVPGIYSLENWLNHNNSLITKCAQHFNIAYRVKPYSSSD